MIQSANIHIINIGKRLKEKESFFEKCRTEFEKLFGIKVSEPEQVMKVIAETKIDGMKVIIRRKLGD